MSDTLQSIFRSAGAFLSGTCLSRITGFFRDIYMAYLFGTEPGVAHFLIAFRLSHLLRRIFGEGALQTVFIPTFETLKQENPSDRFNFFRTLQRTLSLFLSGLVIVLGLLVWILVAQKIIPEEWRETAILTLIMLPSLILISLFGLNGAILQCEKRYFLPGVAPVAFNLTWILTLGFLHRWPQENPFPYLACGIILSCGAQWLITVPTTYRLIKTHPSSNEHNSWKKYPMKQFLLPFGCVLGGVAASQINQTADLFFAQWANSEGAAFLWYAMRVQQLPLAIFGVALSNALLPPLTRALKEGQEEQYKFFLQRALSIVVQWMIPVTCLIWLLGDLAIPTISERGEFFHESTIHTTECLWGYSLGLIPSVGLLVLNPAFYAQRNYKKPIWLGSISIILNILLNSLFIFFFHWGVVSIAIATSISSWINFLFLGISLSKQKIEPYNISEVTPLIKWIASNLLGGGVLLWIREQFASFDTTVSGWLLIPTYTLCFVLTTLSAFIVIHKRFFFPGMIYSNSGPITQRDPASPENISNGRVERK